MSDKKIQSMIDDLYTEFTAKYLNRYRENIDFVALNINIPVYV